ncbi:hypothetical protein AN191_13100 [Loktanella sp. 5RATIMAR09]|nr:hypothetical protein AN191_13100 [Loktanella sp. 5RATIMAR09]
MFGSLHTHPLPDNVKDYAFYVPDTFAAGPECFPEQYEVFQAFNLAMTGKNASQVNSGIALKEAARFVAASPGLGISGRTLTKLVGQIASERLNKNRLVRRRTSQVQIAFDFFLKALWREHPEASFFFTNHVASSLHRYWPSLFPEDYEDLRYDLDWLTAWKNEIPFTLHEADYQVSQLIAFTERNPGYKLIVATSMGQAAVQGTERENRRVVVTGLNRLMKGLGLGDEEWKKRPAMVPHYNAWITPEKRNEFLQKLSALTINGKCIRAEPLGEGIYRLEISLINQAEILVEFEGGPADPAVFGIANLDLQDAAGSNAYHVPDGILAIYDPRIAGSLERHRISTLDVAPTILQNFGITPPQYMQSGFKLG